MLLEKAKICVQNGVEYKEHIIMQEGLQNSPALAYTYANLRETRKLNPSEGDMVLSPLS